MTATRKSPFSIQRSAFTVSPRAFTIIEIMVVVTIIIILMAILLPAVSAAKRSAKIAETKSLLTSLTTDIEAYYTTFNAYPGPAASVTTAATVATPTKLTGTQNLLLGLAYSCNSPGGATNPSAVQVLPNVAPSGSNPAITGLADPASPTGPADFSATNPTTPVTYKTYSAFYTPTAKELSPYLNRTAGSPPNPDTLTWPNSGTTVTPVVATRPFPTILDRFTDPLPILYYRKSPGVDGTGTFDTTGNVVSQAATPITSTDPTTKIAAFYLNDNIEYTAATSISSPAGISFDQTAPANTLPLNGANGLNNLATEIAANNNLNATSHGGYVLISAGPDRRYGGGNKSDDIVVVGGQ